MKRLATLALLFVALSSRGQELQMNPSNTTTDRVFVFKQQPEPKIFMQVTHERCLTIFCDEKGGRVELDLKTGAATFINCQADDAAKVFWKAVEFAFPHAFEKSR